MQAAGNVEAASEVFACRPMGPGDIAFVRDSWLRSAWHQESLKLKRQGVKMKDRIRAGRSWFEALRPHVTKLIDDTAIRIVVACDREDPTHIAAWMAVKGDEPLRMYVKQAYRGWGVEQLLRESV